MKEVQQYIQYIQAMRATPDTQKILLLELSQSGFVPSMNRLRELAVAHHTIQETLLNRSITITLDTGGLAGHIYIEDLPVYNAKTNKIEIGAFGYNPEKNGKIHNFWSAGKVLDESSRIQGSYEKISKKLLVSEEQWEKLGKWASEEKTKNTQYFLLSHKNLLGTGNTRNCFKFTEMALKEIGKDTGLLGVFSDTELEKFQNPALILSAFSRSRLVLKRDCHQANLTEKECEKFLEYEIKKREADLTSSQANYLNHAVEAFWFKTSLKKTQTSCLTDQVSKPVLENIESRFLKLEQFVKNRIDSHRAHEKIQSSVGTLERVSVPSIFPDFGNRGSGTLTGGVLARANANAYDWTMQGNMVGLGGVPLSSTQTIITFSKVFQEADRYAYEDFMRGAKLGLGRLQAAKK